MHNFTRLNLDDKTIKKFIPSRFFSLLSSGEAVLYALLENNEILASSIVTISKNEIPEFLVIYLTSYSEDERLLSELMEGLENRALNAGFDRILFRLIEEEKTAGKLRDFFIKENFSELTGSQRLFSFSLKEIKTSSLMKYADSHKSNAKKAKHFSELTQKELVFLKNDLALRGKKLYSTGHYGKYSVFIEDKGRVKGFFDVFVNDESSVSIRDIFILDENSLTFNFALLFASLLDFLSPRFSPDSRIYIRVSQWELFFDLKKGIKNDMTEERILEFCFFL